MRTSIKLFRLLLLLTVPAGAMLAPQCVFTQDDVPPPPSPNTALGGGRGSIVGRVVLPSGQPITERCRVTLSSILETDRTVYTDNNGGFGFGGLPEATYTLEITGDGKLYDVVTQEVRLLRGMQVRLVINLKEKKPSPGSNAGSVISAAEADPNVPKPARNDYEKGTRLAAEEKIAEAIERFKHAIELYPGYLMARNDLGVQYLKLKRTTEAVDQFEGAIEINPNAFNPRLNLGIVLVEQKKYLEAIDHLTLAVSIDSAQPAAHLYFGMASLETDDLPTAERELSKALALGSAEYSIAHFYIAHLQMKKGDRDGAIRELKTYLEGSPSGEKATQSRALLEKLKQQQ